MNYQKIILPTLPQVDTIIAIFLLKKFGKEKYPGIENASIEIWTSLPPGKTIASLEEEGYFLIDIGGGKFDHHSKGKTASQIVAEDLNLEGDPALSKLLAFAERSDKYGLGTISTDPIDKAFGLTGLISDLRKILPENPRKIVDLVLPLIHAHYLEEKRRYKDLPEEFEKKLKEGRAEVFIVKQGKKKLKVVAIETDNPSIVGWLRSTIGPKADVVLQRGSSGHANIITRPLKKIDLRFLVALLRKEEITRQEREVTIPPLELIKPGKVPEVPEWYYDKATNSILNGGLNPKGTTPTSIPFERIKELIREGLSYPLFQKTFLPETQEAQYFLEIRIPIEIAKKIREKIESATAGVKLHLPENYHITLIYLGKYSSQELSFLFEKIQSLSNEIKPFSIEVNSKHLKEGEIPGYEAKAFYFPILEKKGGKELKEIHSKLKKIVPYFKVQKFSPHLTIANVTLGIEKEVAKEAKIKLKRDFKIKFLVNKIRLTEIIRKPDRRIVYRTKQNFLLGE